MKFSPIYIVYAKNKTGKAWGWNIANRLIDAREIIQRSKKELPNIDFFYVKYTHKLSTNEVKK